MYCCNYNRIFCVTALQCRPCKFTIPATGGNPYPGEKLFCGTNSSNPYFNTSASATNNNNPASGFWCNPSKVTMQQTGLA